jgi:hypothetical protein
MENEVHKALAVLDKSTGKLLNYRQLLRHPVYQGDWTISSANEFGRLAQGVGGRIKGTDTIRFIRKSDIPQDRRKDVTYGRFVCNVRPEKAEPNRTRFTVGGDRINYPGEVATPTAEMLTAKLLFNSVISTPGAKFMTMDISNFYLMTPSSATYPRKSSENTASTSLRSRMGPSMSSCDSACTVSHRQGYSPMNY